MSVDIMELAVTEWLNRNGFRQKLYGYRYIRAAIEIAIRDEEAAKAVKVIYLEIKKRYGESTGNIERNMRTSIADAWVQSGGYFDGLNMKERPSNKLFIAAVADMFRIQLRAQL